MTCLAVVRDGDGHLWFAGDRRISWDFAKAIKGPRPKITKRNGILFAGTGTSAICDLVTDQFDVPDKDEHVDSYTYIHKVFTPQLLKWLRREHWVREDERKLHYEHLESTKDEDLPSATIIIGIDSDLYELDIDTYMISVDAIDAPYAAGCGGALAHGSLLTTEKLKMSPKERLRTALRVAALVSPGCDSSIDILNNK